MKRQPRAIEVGDAMPRLTEGWISLFANEHQPDDKRGGCTCGFCAWSGEHVAIMAYREACEHLGIHA